MADEEKKEGAEGDAKAEEAKPSLIQKLLPKILMPLVAVVGMGAGAGLMFLMKKDHAPPAQVEAAEPEEGKGEGKAKEEKGEEGHAEEDAAHAKADEEAEEAPKKKDEEAEAEAKPEGEKAAEGEAPAEGDKPAAGTTGLMVKFDPLVVNIAEKNSIHYLKLQLEMQVSSEETVLEIDQNKAQIRDRLVFIFSDSSLREVLSTGGKALLKEDIQAALNKILTKGKVTNVFFTDFTVQ